MLVLLRTLFHQFITMIAKKDKHKQQNEEDSETEELRVGGEMFLKETGNETANPLGEEEGISIHCTG